MNFSLITSYPWYFTLFCLLLGAGFAWFAYRKSNISTGEQWYSWPVWLLALLRFLSVSLLTFLLLSPVIKSLFKKADEPVIVLAVDNSQSILLNKDSALYNAELQQRVNELKESLEEAYDVRTFTFGSEAVEGLEMDFQEKQTDLSGLYDRLYNTFYNQNIGAVITLTDGIYNQGLSPVYTAEKFNAPFYMVALGDTIPQRDVVIKNVRYNQVVYSGNDFPLEVQLRAKGYRGQAVNISVSNKGKVLSSKRISFSEDNHYSETSFQINASSPGLQHYRVHATSLDGEISYVNNSYDLFIDVIDSKKKVLMVARAPHPDISAIKNSIERNAFYEVSVYSYDEYLRKNIGQEQLKNYQLVILHQLPGTGTSAMPLLNALKEEGVSTWFVLGNQSDLNTLTSLDLGIRVQGSGFRSNEVSGALNQQFSLFQVNPELEKELNIWPPLFSPFGEYSGYEPAKVLLWQQIGKVKTNMPLLVFAQSGSRKLGFLAGEGIWRWFLNDYSNNQNHEITDELVNKTVQYLSLKSDSRLFRLRPTKNIFYEDEKITFEAELYNPSYEPIRDANVNMTVRNTDGKEFDFAFQPRGSGYFLDAGFLPAGTYTYLAKTRIGDKPYQLTGEFIVKKVELEYLETQANHRLLYNIAHQQGGNILFFDQMSTIPDLLKEREDVQTVAYMQTDFKDLIEFKWLFGLLLLLLAGEWFLRKYYGSY